MACFNIVMLNTGSDIKLKVKQIATFAENDSS